MARVDLFIFSVRKISFENLRANIAISKKQGCLGGVRLRVILYDWPWRLTVFIRRSELKDLSLWFVSRNASHFGSPSSFQRRKLPFRNAPIQSETFRKRYKTFRKRCENVPNNFRRRSATGFRKTHGQPLHRVNLTEARLLIKCLSFHGRRKGHMEAVAIIMILMLQMQSMHASTCRLCSAWEL